MPGKSSVVCGRCGQLVEVKDSRPGEDMLAHGQVCKATVKRDLKGRKGDGDRTLTLRSGKDRRGSNTR